MLVRKLCLETSFQEMQKLLQTSFVSSGHNYLIADKDQSEHWEVIPELAKKVPPQAPNLNFHTNHCLHPSIIELESKNHLSATTHKRYDLLTQETHSLKSSADLLKLLQSHKGYPFSICSHYKIEGSVDPSQTCGGGIFNHHNGEFWTWRGCPEYDDHYIIRKFRLDQNDIQKI